MQKSVVALRWLTPPIAGALVTLSLAPFSLWPLGIVAAFLMALIWRQQTPRAAALSGWLFGLGLFGSGVSWVYVSIHVHGYAPVPLAAFLTLIFVAGLALFPALQGWLLARLFRRNHLWLLLSFPALWVLFEWLRGWIFTGFPWLYLGNAHLDTPLAGWAPVLGVYGLSYLTALTGAAVLAAADRRRTGIAAVAIVIAVWGAGFALQGKTWSQPNGEPLRVALVQGNIPQELKWLDSEKLNIVRTYRELSQPYWGYDIVLWPETAVPIFLHQARPLLNTLAEEANAQGTTLITGIPSAFPRVDDTGYNLHNSIIALSNDKEDVYHKQKLVPFGEYVPLESVLRGLIDFFNLPMSSFTPGPQNQPLLSMPQAQIMPFICYEVVYPDFVAAHAGRSDVLITISNDSWFGASIGPHQHLQIAQMRALETARYMLRGTNNGISAIIDHKGRLTEISGQFRQEVLTGTVEPRTGATPFSQTGSVPILVIATVLGLLARDTRKKVAKN